MIVNAAPARRAVLYREFIKRMYRNIERKTTGRPPYGRLLFFMKKAAWKRAVFFTGIMLEGVIKEIYKEI